MRAGIQDSRWIINEVRRQPLEVLAVVEELGKLVGQLSLRFDRAKNRLLPLGEHPKLGESRLDMPDLLFIEPTGLILPVPLPGLSQYCCWLHS